MELPSTGITPSMQPLLMQTAILDSMRASCTTRHHGDRAPAIRRISIRKERSSSGVLRLPQVCGPQDLTHAMALLKIGTVVIQDITSVNLSIPVSFMNTLQQVAIRKRHGTTSAMGKSFLTTPKHVSDLVRKMKRKHI